MILRQLIRRAVLGGRRKAAPGRTYAEWLARAAALAPTEVAMGGGPPAFVSGPLRLTMGTPSGSMRGTTFDSLAGVTHGSESGSSFGTPCGRMAQHAFPDQTTFDENVASGRVVVMEMEYRALVTNTFLGITRNGFQSTAETQDGGSWRILNLLFWDAALGKVRQFPAYNNGPVTDYTWP